MTFNSSASFINTLFLDTPELVYPAIDALVAGDVCYAPTDNGGEVLCCIQRIGWADGELSPYPMHNVLQAYVFGFYEDGEVWVEWINLNILVGADAAGINRFCAYVNRDLEVLARSFSVVAKACSC